MNKEQVNEVLYSCGPDDILEIIFLDASLTHNVRRLDNKVVASYKKVIGRFWCIKDDMTYREGHVILKAMESNGDQWDVYSIPISVIVNVGVISPAQRFKRIGEVGFPILSGKGVKVVSFEGVGERN